ncbi:MAG TPA: hypothetical protein VK841_06665 [Polyangiaceae bacterium]|nr:hypothetical protein [Polyangiaceae bacterium]
MPQYVVPKLRTPIGGGTTTTLASSANGFNQINFFTINAGSLYIANANPPLIASMPIGGGAITTIATSTNGVVTPVQVMVNSNDIYWFDSATTNIMDIRR